MKTENKTIKKRYFALFGFIVAMVWSLYKLIFLTPFAYMKEIEINKGIDVTIEKSFNHGCYDIGFYANDNRFSSPAYLPYKVEGEYEFEFYHKDSLLSKQMIEKGQELGHTYSKGGLAGASSSIILYVLETPLKNHTRLRIKLKSTKLESRLKEGESFYLYIDKHRGICGEKRTAWINKKNNPIEKVESNETLKPLYRALISKNSNRVKELIENNLSVDVEMIGERNPVHYSAFYDDEKTLNYLIAKGAKLNEKDLTGKTPLQYAIEHNSTKVLEALLDGGVDFSLVGIVEDTYFYPPGAPLSAPADEMQLIKFLTERNMVEMMEIFLRKGYLNGNNLYEYCLNGKKCRKPKLDRLISLQKNHDDIRYRKKYKALDYLKMIKLLRAYGAKTYNELEEDANLKE